MTRHVSSPGDCSRITPVSGNGALHLDPLTGRYNTILNLVRFLTKGAPKLKKGKTNMQIFNIVDAWMHSDFLCRNCVKWSARLIV